MQTTLEIKTPRWALPLLEKHRYKGTYGGRGSGKSHFFAEMLIENHVANPNLNSVCIREIQSSIKMSVKKLLEDKIISLGVESYFEIQEAQIKSRNGNGIIIFQGMQTHTSDSIKSLEGFEICWCEEAQSLSQRSLDMLRPTIRKEGSEMWFSWNPDEPTDPIDVLLRTERKDSEVQLDAAVVRVNFDDNPWFPKVLRDEMEYDKSHDKDKYSHVWLGNYRENSEARVFSNWKIEEFEAPPEAMFRLGGDWGYSNDPNVMIRCHIVGKKLYIDYEAYKIGCEIEETPDLFGTIPESEKWPCTSDSAKPEMISYMKRHGFPKMYGAKKGKNSLYEGVAFLQSYEIIIHPRCKHTIDEFTLYSWKVDPLTGKITNILLDKKNHVIDSVRYACEGARRAAGQIVTEVKDNPTENYWNHVR